MFVLVLLYLLLAFTEKRKWELIVVKLRLERKGTGSGVLLAHLLDGARSDNGQGASSWIWWHN